MTGDLSESVWKADVLLFQAPRGYKGRWKDGTFRCEGCGYSCPVVFPDVAKHLQCPMCERRQKPPKRNK